MLPLILVAVGAYLIGDSVLEDKKLAKGGKTQGYDDKEDERLAMEHGKMAKKDLDSTHARRDDARFEERGKMAKGGELEWANEENEKLGKWLLDNQSGKKILEDSKNSKELEKNVRDYAKEHNGIAGLEMDDEDEGLEWVTFDDLYKELKSRSKMAKGGKLVGKQKNLDVNKNGKLDAEDFKMLRKGK
jgi:hypothetical protein